MWAALQPPALFLRCHVELALNLRNHRIDCGPQHSPISAINARFVVASSVSAVLAAAKPSRAFLVIPGIERRIEISPLHLDK
jgi:tRNA(Phe) wybutosine-synthesizing methylase Tyw3